MRLYWIAALKTDENGGATEILVAPKAILATDQRSAELKVAQQMSDEVNLDSVRIIATPFESR